MPEPLVAARPARVIPIYELQRNQKNLLNKYSGTDLASQEKVQKGVNLLEGHWDLLDELAEKRGKSRNQILRDILTSYAEDV